MEDTLVPIFALLIVIGAPIAAWVVTRVLSHQERMEMMRQGFAPPPDPRAMRRAAKYGWQPGATPPGPPGGAPPPYINYGYDTSFNAQQHLRKGMQVAFVGLALLIGLSFIRHGEFGPWLLGGLIPLFIGVAQVITAVMGGARIGGGPVGAGPQSFSPPPMAGAPPSGPSASRQAPSGPSGPYGWRPGPTPEIEKPAGPPDYR